MRKLASITFGLIGIGLSGQAMAGITLAQSSQLFGGEVEQSMRVDIRPDSKDNLVDPRAGRVFPMAILGADDFDIKIINPRTITLEGVEILLVGKTDKSVCRESDSNGDGILDLICQVQITGFRVPAGEHRIRVEAETYDKLRLQGEDVIRVPGN